MNDLLLIPILLCGAIIFYFGLLTLGYFPLALSYCVWERRLKARAAAIHYTPRVSVLVPAYNEEKTISPSIQSILDSDYPDFEVIVINDGSTDATERELQPFIARRLIRYYAKKNGGKASALNVGIARATGDIIFFSDADSLFEKNTIRNGVMYFSDPATGAVSGNDTPLNPRGVLQKMLVVTSHIGTGFVRRALSVASVLPIIPGNLGIVRWDILRAIGGFREVWGEDLEITLRLHRHGVRIVYGASTKVIAECPHTLTGLWKQRVRWIRSYITVLSLHRDMIGRPTYGRFSIYLLFNIGNMLLIPILQLATLFLLPMALYFGVISLQAMEWVAYLGFGFLFIVAIISILLDRSPRDLIYLPYSVALIPLSFFYSAVVIYSIWLESRAHAADWNKVERRNPRELPPIDDPFRRRLMLGGAAVAGVAVVGPLLPINTDELHAMATELLEPNGRPGGNLVVSIHFSDWPDWRNADQSLLLAPEAIHVNQVAISAGRPDWTFFQWQGREQWWSPEQQDTDGDMLDNSAARLTSNGYGTIATLDVLAPRYLQANPHCAAVDIAGKSSPDIVCSTCLAQGDYGDLLDAAFTALASKNKIDAICITELFYDVNCFDERCRAAYQASTGRATWPRDAEGKIEWQHPSVGKWRSQQVAQAVARLSTIARTHKKKLLVDVRVSRDDLTRNSNENGQDYRLLLPLVDRLVVWDYFAMDRLSPRATGKVARYMSRQFGPDCYWHSIGLWDHKGGAIDATQLARAIRSARQGGSSNIWVTPAKDLTNSHWEALAALKLGKGYTKSS